MTRNLLACMALLLLGGCVTNAANSVTVFAQGGDPQFKTPNSGLDSACSIETGRVLYEGDILLGTVTLLSHEDEKQSFNSRWRWYDADGELITIGEGQQVWRTVWVDALDEPQLQGRAPTPGAVKGEFQLRWVAERD